MDKPVQSEREKFDAVTYQQFKPDPPKQPKGVWRVVRLLIIVLFFAFVFCLLFLH